MRLKRLALSLTILGAVAIPAAALAAKPLYLQGKYCWSTGSYWQAQLSNPNNTKYYAKHAAQLNAEFGPTTNYCP